MKSELKLSVRPAVVWFDLDDTLIDFHEIARMSLRVLYKTARLDRWVPTVDRWVEDYVVSNSDLWRRYALAEVSREFLRLERMRAPLRPFWNGSEEELTQIAQELDPEYLDIMVTQRAVMPDARELLESLRGRGYRIGILSNGFKQVQRRKLVTAGLDDLVDIVVLSDDIGINKPAIDIYRYAMELTGEMNPGRHLMVGDNPETDIAGAVNAGWDTIHFRPDLGENVVASGNGFATGSLAKIADIIP